MDEQPPPIINGIVGLCALVCLGGLGLMVYGAWQYLGPWTLLAIVVGVLVWHGIVRLGARITTWLDEQFEL